MLENKKSAVTVWSPRSPENQKALPELHRALVTCVLLDTSFALARHNTHYSNSCQYPNFGIIQMDWDIFWIYADFIAFTNSRKSTISQQFLAKLAPAQHTATLSIV